MSVASPGSGGAGAAEGTGGLPGLLTRQGFAVIDGGLATELERRGADLRDSLWSARLLLPEEQHADSDSTTGGGAELIKAVHRSYLEAGADIIITSSYQASVKGLLERGLSQEAAELLLRRSLRLAHEARSEFWAEEENRKAREWPLVAASIGPYGAYLTDGNEYKGDYGETMGQEELIAFHKPRIDMLLSDPTIAPDLFACETIPCLIEAQALVKLFETEYPTQRIWLTFTCRDDEHISNGQRFSEVSVLLQSYVVTITSTSEGFVLKPIGSNVVLGVGVNCSGPQYIRRLLESVHTPNPAKPFIVYPNSGEGWDPATYDWTPRTGSEETLDQLVKQWYDLGARVVGGCCRTTPGKATPVEQQQQPSPDTSKPMSVHTTEDIKTIRSVLSAQQKPSG